MFDDFPDVLTPEEVGKALRISKTNVYKLLQEGKIKSKKIGKKYIIPKLYIMEYIRNTD